MQKILSALERTAQAAKEWRIRRQQIRRLGSERKAEREAAIAWFTERRYSNHVTLRRALRGSIRVACGAAVALDRLQDSFGVRTVLLRCQDEEWLTLRIHSEYPETLLALRWLPAETLADEFHRALRAAEVETDLTKILAHLSLALSAIRVLNLRPAIPIAVLECALLFGHSSLRRLLRTNGTILAANLTNAIRLEAVRGLLAQDADERLPLFLAALQSEDLSVMRTAIGGLRRAGDRRAAPALHTLAFSGGHPLSELAREAYARIAGPQAAPLVLLRPSQEDPVIEELLRPASNALTSDNVNLLSPHPHE